MKQDSSNFWEIFLQEQYSSGIRDFRRSQLKGANLQKINLSYCDLSEADLEGADLRESNLEKVNLKGANLEGAFLSKAVLKGAILQKANLKKAYLTDTNFLEANLIDTNLEQTHLNKANLAKAILDKASFQKSFLIGACLRGAKLRTANLCDVQLAGVDLIDADLTGAFYNENTDFEEDFNPIAAQMVQVRKIVIKEVLVIFNDLYQLGCKYLGKTMISKYWKSSCPNGEWIHVFPIDNSSKITFLGSLIEPVSPLQLSGYRQWMQAFINSCSSIIQDFSFQKGAIAKELELDPLIKPLNNSIEIKQINLGKEPKIYSDNLSYQSGETQNLDPLTLNSSLKSLKQKILIIEDDAQVRENIQEIIELENFEAFVAKNGYLGIQLAKQQTPHLIICDVMMPGIDGYGVLKALRQYRATSTTPFIFLTAKVERSDMRKGMEQGADDYLTKPFTPSELLQAINSRLKKHAVIESYYNSFK